MFDIGNKLGEIQENASKELGYLKIKPEGNISLEECRNYVSDLFKEKTTPENNLLNMDKLSERKSIMPVEGHGGHWEGERGDSYWMPDKNEIPGDRNGTNPEHKTWGEILEKYGIEGIRFKDGEPDFSEISKGNVKIDDFSDDRDSNFAQADEKLAEQRGCTPEEVEKWRKENGYTWHECKDCQTMQKVPREVHGNIPHSGGISEMKKRQEG